MREIEDFAGFPTPTHATPVPEVFFAEILPRLTSPEEIKLFLVALRRIRSRKGAIRSVTARELADATELGTLTVSTDDGTADEDRLGIVRRVMGDFVVGAVFLEVTLSDGDVAYFVNDSEGRRAFERVRAGDATLSVAADAGRYCGAAAAAGRDFPAVRGHHRADTGGRDRGGTFRGGARVPGRVDSRGL